MALSDARRKVEEAREIISAVWSQNELVRTPRLADAVSLLERASSKLLKEIRGRACTDEESKAATDEFLNRAR